MAIHDSETLLNINEKILALEVAQLDTVYDVIIVGTASSVLAYDAYKNTNMFHREVTDGVNCIQVKSSVWLTRKHLLHLLAYCVLRLVH